MKKLNIINNILKNNNSAKKQIKRPKSKEINKKLVIQEIIKNK
jgi:hypothetical protein